MINIAICDDYREFGEITEKLIKAIMKKNNISCNISTFISGLSLVQAFYENKFDIIFLDMEMPETDGIKTGLLIREISDKPIIFYLTSHKEYAYESYSVKAKNYLLKPVNAGVLEKEIMECMKEIREPMKYLDIKDTEGIIHRIPLDDITHILKKKEDRKLHIYTLDKNEIISVQALEKVENSLSHSGCFKRAGKSCLVNLDNIRVINKNIIYFINGETEIASRRCLSELMSLFKEKNRW